MARPSIEGKRIHVILTKRQIRNLRELSELTGLTLAEHVRRAVDLYLAPDGGSRLFAEREDL